MKQTVLITGASSGIGKALAHQFASKGFDIVAVDSKDARLDLAAAELRAQHCVAVTEIVRDLAVAGAPEEVHEEVRQRGIVVDVLVNDAGVGQGGPFSGYSHEQDLHLIRLNVEALTVLTKLFLRDMLSRGCGRILNVGSVAGFQPGPLLAVCGRGCL